MGKYVFPNRTYKNVNFFLANKSADRHGLFDGTEGRGSETNIERE